MPATQTTGSGACFLQSSRGFHEGSLFSSCIITKIITKWKQQVLGLSVISIRGLFRCSTTSVTNGALQEPQASLKQRLSAFGRIHVFDLASGDRP